MKSITVISLLGMIFALAQGGKLQIGKIEKQIEEAKKKGDQELVQKLIKARNKEEDKAFAGGLLTCVGVMTVGLPLLAVGECRSGNIHGDKIADIVETTDCWKVAIDRNELVNEEAELYEKIGMPLHVLEQHLTKTIMPPGSSYPVIYRNKRGEQFILRISYVGEKFILLHCERVPLSIEN